jgi:hypothetical protein
MLVIYKKESSVDIVMFGILGYQIYYHGLGGSYMLNFSVYIRHGFPHI